MTKAVAINGSPRMDKGNTALVLNPFIEGMTDAGCDVELFYAGRLKAKPCNPKNWPPIRASSSRVQSSGPTPY